MHLNVLSYEPEKAIFVDDKNPLIFYHAIAQIAFDKLLSGGLVYVEINEKFGNEVAEVFKIQGLTNTLVIKDINEKDRFVKAEKP
jgi:release factor glutamine methyltransferase